MGKSARIACMIAACLAWAAAGEAADFTRIGPQATASQLVAAHGAAAGPVLRLVYGSTSPDAATKTVEIARDYVFVRTKAAKPEPAMLDDYALRRLIAIDEEHHSFGNMSMYAMADFRFAEAYNRRVLRGILRSAGLKNPAVHPFFEQQELGIASPEDGAVEFEREHTAAGGLRFVVDGKTGAAYEPSAESLSPEEMQGLLRFLRAGIPLHPEMLAAINAGGKLPREIVTMEGVGDSRAERRWTLISVERAQGTYPLKVDDQPEVIKEGSSSPLAGLLPLMLEAVAGRAHGGPRSLANYRTAMSEALAKGNVLQHFLLDNEVYLQYRSGTTGCLNANVLHEDCSRQQEIVDRWMADSETMKAIQLLALDRTNPEQSIAQRNAMPRAGLSNPYMLDLWNADIMMQSGKGGDPVPLFAAAINGNPYVGGFYKDLGDAFRHRFMPAEAWLCYDLARALPGAQSSPVVDGIDKMEAAIAARTPEFF